MKHFIKILEIKNVSATGEVLWEQKNILNIIHEGGEQLVLNAAFAGGPTSNAYIPANYYFGLDARSTLATTDTMNTIFLCNEPTTNGYARVAVSSTGQFVITQALAGYYVATSPIVTFSATAATAGWGPVNNMFMSNTNVPNSGVLIASVPLNSPQTVAGGGFISAKLGIAMGDCSVLL